MPGWREFGGNGGGKGLTTKDTKEVGRESTRMKSNQELNLEKRWFAAFCFQKNFRGDRDLSLRSRFQKKLSVLLCVLYGQAVFFCPAKYQYTGTPANITSVITIVPTNEWCSLSINV